MIEFMHVREHLFWLVYMYMVYMYNARALVLFLYYMYMYFASLVNGHKVLCVSLI